MASASNTTSKKGGKASVLVYIGKKKTKEVKIHILDFNKDKLREKIVTKVEECFPFKKSPTKTWINVNGIHDVKVVEKIGKYFDLHPLVMDAIVNTNQRPKIEDFGKYLFVILKMIFLDEHNKLNIEQVSLIVGSNYIISFQEADGDVFNNVRERIRNKESKIRKEEEDYLLYSLMDAIVDGYYSVLEYYGEKIETLEEELVEKPSTKTLNNIRRFKRDLLYFRKAAWPLREIISNLERGESRFIKKQTTFYLRDLYDHTIQIMDTIETFRDMVSGMFDVYLSSINNRMNEIMKVLTIIATIFIPLTFITGIYGMNFDFMPELGWRYGYYLIWGIIIAIGVLMIALFKRKKWF